MRAVCPYLRTGVRRWRGAAVSDVRPSRQVRKVRKKGVLKADDLLPLADGDQSAHLGSRRPKSEPADSDGEPETAVTDDTGQSAVTREPALQLLHSLCSISCDELTEI